MARRKRRRAPRGECTVRRDDRMNPISGFKGVGDARAYARRASKRMGYGDGARVYCGGRLVYDCTKGRCSRVD